MTIIKIGALWCPGCLMVNNSINKLKKEYDINLIEYDYDFNPEVKEYNVGNVLPVLIFMKYNKEISRIVGERSYKEIKNEIEKMEK